MKPLYQFRDEQTFFKHLLITIGVMLISIAVLFPLYTGYPFDYFVPLRIFIAVMGALILILTHELRVKAWRDHIEVTYGPTSLIRFSIVRDKILRIKAIEYNPLTDFGGWGIRTGAGRWAGWVAFSASGTNRVLAIETTDKNYILTCPDPDEAESKLKWILGIKSKDREVTLDRNTA